MIGMELAGPAPLAPTAIASTKDELTYTKA